MHSAVLVLAVGLLQATKTIPPPPTACELLTATDVQGVQTVAVKEVKPSNELRHGLRFGQCVYATTDFAHSVSVALITADARRAVHAYWQETFRGRDGRREKKISQDEEDEQEARRIAGLGDEAFWTGDARAGALYVFSDAAILRISVGGVAEEAERIRRTRQLATTALRRMNRIRRD